MAADQTRWLCWSAVCLVFCGCAEDGIQQYRVPKMEQPRQRLLGAIVPFRDRVWFFKLTGPEQHVAAHKNTFDDFVRSVRFDQSREKPIDWTVPSEWREEKATGMRFATFRLGTNDESLELTVTPLGVEAASIVDNVNRWRGQIGLAGVSQAELEKLVKHVSIGDTIATIVDMTGNGAREDSGAPPVEPSGVATSPREGGQRRIQFTTPEGWKEKPRDAKGFRAAAFEISEGGRSAEMTVIPLPGAAGGLLQNVNRWRAQINLGPWSNDDLRHNVRKLDVSGIAASYFDLGAEGSDDPRILAIALDRGGESWFFKLTGPADLVGKHKPAFERFMRSVQFTAHADKENDNG